MGLNNKHRELSITRTKTGDEAHGNPASRKNLSDVAASGHRCFPHMIVPLFVGREKSVKALDAAMMKDRQIVLMTQKDSVIDDPMPDDMHTVGTLGNVVQLLRLPDGTVKALVEGLERVKIKKYADNTSFLRLKSKLLKKRKTNRLK